MTPRSRSTSHRQAGCPPDLTRCGALRSDHGPASAVHAATLFVSVLLNSYSAVLSLDDEPLSWPATNPIPAPSGSPKAIATGILRSATMAMTIARIRPTPAPPVQRRGGTADSCRRALCRRPSQACRTPAGGRTTRGRPSLGGRAGPLSYLMAVSTRESLIPCCHRQCG